MSPSVVFVVVPENKPSQILDSEEAAPFIKKLFPTLDPERILKTFELKNSATAFDGEIAVHEGVGVDINGKIVDSQGPAYRINLSAYPNGFGFNNLKAEPPRRRYAKELFSNVVALAQDAKVPEMYVNCICDEGGWFWLAKCGVQPNEYDKPTLRFSLLHRLRLAETQITNTYGSDCYNEIAASIKSLEKTPDGWQELALRKDITVEPDPALRFPNTAGTPTRQPLGRYLFVNNNYTGRHPIPPRPQ